LSAIRPESVALLLSDSDALMYNKSMVKQKKRNKKYSGADATVQRPKITRITAANRSKLSQWIFDRKKIIRIIGITLLIVIAIVITVSGIVSLFR
jgi:hypothetical protein